MSADSLILDRHFLMAHKRSNLNNCYDNWESLSYWTRIPAIGIQIYGRFVATRSAELKQWQAYRCKVARCYLRFHRDTKYNIERCLPTVTSVRDNKELATFQPLNEGAATLLDKSQQTRRNSPELLHSFAYTNNTARCYLRFHRDTKKTMNAISTMTWRRNGLRVNGELTTFQPWHEGAKTL